MQLGRTHASRPQKILWRISWRLGPWRQLFFPGVTRARGQREDREDARFHHLEVAEREVDLRFAKRLCRRDELEARAPSLEVGDARHPVVLGREITRRRRHATAIVGDRTPRRACSTCTIACRRADSSFWYAWTS